MSTYFFCCRNGFLRLDRRSDLVRHTALHQPLGLTDGVVERLGVGTAVGLDDAAVDAQQGRPAHLGIVHLFLQRGEGGFGDGAADGAPEGPQ